MMETISLLINKILSETGLLSAMLFISCLYEKWELYNERKKTQALNDKVFELAQNQVSAMNQLQHVIKNVMELVHNGRSKE